MASRTTTPVPPTRCLRSFPGLERKTAECIAKGGMSCTIVQGDARSPSSSALVRYEHFDTQTGIHGPAAPLDWLAGGGRVECQRSDCLVSRRNRIHVSRRYQPSYRGTLQRYRKLHHCRQGPWAAPQREQHRSTAVQSRAFPPRWQHLHVLRRRISGSPLDPRPLDAFVSRRARHLEKRGSSVP